MKIKRQKKVINIISFYEKNFGFRAPVDVLLDATFCKAALEGKLDIRDQIPKYLPLATNLISTRCIIEEVKKLKDVFQGAQQVFSIMKNYSVQECGHSENPLDAAACIKDLLQKNNPKRYIVATTDRSISNYIKNKVAGAPILYINGHTPILEKPSPKSIKYIATASSSLTSHESEVLRLLKERILGPTPVVEPTIGKKKKKFLFKRNRKKAEAAAAEAAALEEESVEPTEVVTQSELDGKDCGEVEENSSIIEEEKPSKKSRKRKSLDEAENEEPTEVVTELEEKPSEEIEENYSKTEEEKPSKKSRKRKSFNEVEKEPKELTEVVMHPEFEEIEENYSRTEQEKPSKKLRKRKSLKIEVNENKNKEDIVDSIDRILSMP